TLRKQVLDEALTLDPSGTVVGPLQPTSGATARMGTQRGEAARDQAVDALTSDEQNTLDMMTTLPSTPPVVATGEFAIPLFSDLPPEALVDLLNQMVVRREAQGAVVIREGDPGDTLYVVAVGSVRVHKKRADGSEIEVARLGPGAFFGEMAL